MEIALEIIVIIIEIIIIGVDKSLFDIIENKLYILNKAKNK